MNDETQEVARAEALIELGRYDDARRLLAALLARDPQDAYAWALLGWCHFLRRAFGDALACADRALAADPSYEWGHRIRASALAQLARPEDAHAAAREAVALDPWSPEALADLAAFAGGAGARQEALDAAKRAAELSPSDPNVWLATGWAAEALGEWDEAERAFRRAVELSPQDPWAHLAHGWVLLQQVRLDEARRALERSLALEPNEAYTKRTLAVTLALLGDDERAGALRRETASESIAFDAAADDRPDVRALYERSCRLEELGRMDDALETAREAVRVDPRSVLALGRVAWLSAHLGLSDDARAALAAAKWSDPDGRATLRWCVLVGALLNDRAEVASAAERMGELYEDTADALHAKGVAALLAGRSIEAVDWLERARRRSRTDCCTAGWLGIAAVRAGDRARAERLRRETRALEPTCFVLPLLEGELSAAADAR